MTNKDKSAGQPMTIAVIGLPGGLEPRHEQLKELVKNPIEGFKVELVDESNLFEWRVWLKGPSGTEYEGGVFKAVMTFPEDYPISPPGLRVLSDFWHPNVYPDGKVCISILHTPDPMNPEERPEETWRPIQTVESILVSVCSMLSDPNFSSPANIDASVELRKNPDVYKKRIFKPLNKSQNELPKDFQMPKPKKHEPPKEENLDDLLDDYDYDDEVDDENDEDQEEGADEMEEGDD